MVVAVLVVFIGAGLARFANENYEALKADGGVGLGIGVGLASIAMVILGIVLFWRSIRTRQEPPPQMARDHAASTGTRGPNLVLLVVAVLIIFFGAGLVRFANENYETLRADGGVGLAIGVGLASIATVIVGVVLFWRSIRTRREPPPQMARPYQASATARSWSSLFGFALGIVACVAMFMAAAARLVNPDTNNVFSGLALLTALAFTLLTVLIGIVGLFMRGRSLHRVPLYFVAGAILTFGVFRVFYIDLTKWPGFVALVQ